MKPMATGIAVSVVLLFATSPSTRAADDGFGRAVGGATDTITSPGRIFEEVRQETQTHGAVGVVTGSIKGGAKAAGQAVTGAANIGVGVIEVLTSPLRN